MKVHTKTFSHVYFSDPCCDLELCARYTCYILVYRNELSYSP
jgi:hypothetical protein